MKIGDRVRLPDGRTGLVDHWEQPWPGGWFDKPLPAVALDGETNTYHVYRPERLTGVAQPKRVLTDPSQMPPNMTDAEEAKFWSEHRVSKEYLDKTELRGHAREENP